MLDGAELVAFVAVRDLAVADAFYGGVLGLPRVEASGFARVYRAGATELRVTRVDALAPAPHTVAGWRVADLDATIAALDAAGVACARFAGLEQDHAGVWTAPGGSRIAWFADPDGNTLSLQQPPSPPRAREGLAAAKDLAVEAPRPLDAELEGYAWLPRMLDKARATLAGSVGPYQFGCPVDHTCMARLGVTPELVLALAGRHAEDGAVLAALREHGIPDAKAAWFDAPAVEDELQQQGTYLRVRRRDELPAQGHGRLFAGAEHGAAASMLLVEAARGEREAAHAHPTEELITVVEGQATFFLGPRQARIVRAGEVVRIPAGVIHRWDNTGDGPLRAVAAYATGTLETLLR